jgi:hypothetical protein
MSQTEICHIYDTATADLSLFPWFWKTFLDTNTFISPYDAICWRFQVGIWCQNIPSTLQSVFFINFSSKCWDVFWHRQKNQTVVGRQEKKKISGQNQLSLSRMYKRPIYLQKTYLRTLVEMLQKYVTAECKTSYYKSMQEGTEIAQVTAQTPAKYGASKRDTGNRMFYSAKCPYWMTKSHIL